MAGSKSNDKATLSWNQRYNIIEGIARGLLYLHRDSRLKIIHRDLKTSNILLDEDMNAKISDFGMARIFRGNQTIANTNRIAGNYGYMSPEYAVQGIFSEKSDVFSFGVILLEIISSKRNSSYCHSEVSFNLLDHVNNEKLISRFLIYSQTPCPQNRNKGKEVRPQGANAVSLGRGGRQDGAPRHNRFYALHGRQGVDEVPNVVTGCHHV